MSCFPLVLVFSMLACGGTQDYQMLYEPMYPSGMKNILKAEKSVAQDLLHTQAAFTNPSVNVNVNPWQTPLKSRNILASPTQTLHSTPYGGTIPGLHGSPCRDLYAECSDYAENNYCKKYRKQMLFQCRKSCGFCNIDPYGTKEDDGESSGLDEQDSGSGDDSSSDIDSGFEEFDQSGHEGGENIDSAPGKTRKSLISRPENTRTTYLSSNFMEEDEKHFSALKSKFKMPGFVPSLEDLYAELGTLHPSESKRNPRKDSRRATKRSKLEGAQNDPFKYLKPDLPGASSIKPVIDYAALTSSKVVRSNPVYLVKSPSFRPIHRRKRNAEKLSHESPRTHEHALGVGRTAP